MQVTDELIARERVGPDPIMRLTCVALVMWFGIVALGSALYVVSRVGRYDASAERYTCYRARTLDAWRLGELQCAAVGVHTRDNVNRESKHDREPYQGSTRDRASAAAE